MFTPNYVEGRLQSITKPATGECVPLDEMNRHYREYLDWVTAGNAAFAEEAPAD